MEKTVLAIIPARGGSKGIPRKNLTDLNGKPLIQYTIDAAQGSKYISKIILSSDDDEIIHYCKESGIEVPFKRPDEFSTDISPMIDVVNHAVVFLKINLNFIPEIIILLQPTSPLRKTYHIDEALEKLLNSNADSIVSVVEVPHNCNPYSIMKIDGDFINQFMKYDERMNLRQYKPKFYARNGPAILAFTYNCLKEKNSFYGDKTLPYFMDKKDSVDIDDIYDLTFAEALIKLENKR